MATQVLCLHTCLGYLLGSKASDDLTVQQGWPDSPSTKLSCPTNTETSQRTPLRGPTVPPGCFCIWEVEKVSLCAAGRAALAPVLSIFSPPQGHPHPGLHSHFSAPAGTWQLLIERPCKGLASEFPHFRLSPGYPVHDIKGGPEFQVGMPIDLIQPVKTQDAQF